MFSDSRNNESPRPSGNTSSSSPEALESDVLEEAALLDLRLGKHFSSLVNSVGKRFSEIFSRSEAAEDLSKIGRYRPFFGLERWFTSGKPIFFEVPGEDTKRFINGDKFRHWGKGFVLERRPGCESPGRRYFTGIGASAFHFRGTALQDHRLSGASVGVHNLKSFDGIWDNQLRYSHHDWVEQVIEELLRGLEPDSRLRLPIGHSGGALAVVCAIERFYQRTGEKLCDAALLVAPPFFLTNESYEALLNRELKRYQKRPDHLRYLVTNVAVPTDWQSTTRNDVKRVPSMRRLLLKATLDLYELMLEARDALRSISERQKTSNGSVSFRDAPYIQMIHGTADHLAGFEPVKALVDDLASEGVVHRELEGGGHSPMYGYAPHSFFEMLNQALWEFEAISDHFDLFRARTRLGSVIEAKRSSRIEEISRSAPLGGGD